MRIFSRRRAASPSGPQRSRTISRAHHSSQVRQLFRRERPCSPGGRPRGWLETRVGPDRRRGPEPLPRDRLPRSPKARRGTGASSGSGRGARGAGPGAAARALYLMVNQNVPRRGQSPIFPSLDQLTWFSCISPSAARAAREHAPRSARGPPCGADGAREGSRYPCAPLASRAFLVRLARAEISMRHSVHVHRTRAHEPPRPPSP